MTDRNVRVGTAGGVVSGFDRDDVIRWRSIPYASPPVGALRLGAPQPPQPWPAVRDCRDFGSCAPQQRRYTMVGLTKYQPMSEDCLTVNVVAPKKMSDDPLPVMVFVHGGGYLLGSSATPIYDGAALARRGCVFVSVNYRLGALGGMDLSSLSTPRLRIDGNLALRDMVAALEWVRDNISGFGGDPGNVTIFGESGGGQAVVTLLAVPAARGLFARVISESPATGLVHRPEAAARQAEKLVIELGARRSTAASTLTQASASALVGALSRIVARTVRQRPGAFVTGPVVDGDYLPRDPLEAMSRGQAHQLPLIVGNNAEEATLLSKYLKLLPGDQLATRRMLAHMDPGSRQKIVAAYTGYPRAAACVQLSADFVFGSAVWQLAEAHARFAPTFVYRYDYAPHTLRHTGVGATHGTELLAVFDCYRTLLGSMLAGGDWRSARRVSDDVQSRWQAFSRCGVPGADWPAYAEPERAVMVFDRRSFVESDPMPARRQAWADLRSPPEDKPLRHSPRQC